MVLAISVWRMKIVSQWVTDKTTRFYIKSLISRIIFKNAWQKLAEIYFRLPRFGRQPRFRYKKIIAAINFKRRPT